MLYYPSVHRSFRHLRITMALLSLSVVLVLTSPGWAHTPEESTAPGPHAPHLNYPVNDPRHIWHHMPKYDHRSDHSPLQVRFDQDFLLGVATAASHYEDQLEDIWTQFARQGEVPGLKDVPQPLRRLDFYSHPETVIALAADAGTQIFRLSLSWERLMPEHPLQHCQGASPCKARIQNREALKRYREILRLIKAHNMKTMVTLFHHDLPSWSVPYYSSERTQKLGWLDPSLKEYFADYAHEITRELGDDMDYVITFNEPTLLSFLTYIKNHWPPGNADPHCTDLPVLNVIMCLGDFLTSMDEIAEAHIKAYQRMKTVHEDLVIGIAHASPYLDNRQSNIPFFEAFMELNKHITLNQFPDHVIDHIEFLGVNYYGEERGNALHHALDIPLHYPSSDTGRQLNAWGLHAVLQHFYQRYPHRQEDLVYFVTESGIADDSDLLRPSFLVEHLKAVAYSIDQGIPVKGFLFWTLSDNWEWADGYCPKFGLVHVDRAQNLKRRLKPSYHFFRAITQLRGITTQMEHYADQLIPNMLSLREERPELARHWDGMRGFCRHSNGINGLDKPVRFPLAPIDDWKFRPPE